MIWIPEPGMENTDLHRYLARLIGRGGNNQVCRKKTITQFQGSN
uniref:Uncharacterized protein n=1 Tax=Anguilla anguilla TaxID=7936 RepID=A0A0E9QLT9_ANGAN